VNRKPTLLVLVGLAPAFGCTQSVASFGPTSTTQSTTGSGSGHSAPPPSGAAVGPVGKTASITQGGKTAARLTVTAVDIATQPGDQYGQPPQNGYYAIVHVSVQVASTFTGGFTVNPLDFYTLVNGQHYSDGDGNAFEALASNQSQMDAATLGAGESTSGLVAFDIPAGHGQVVYAPNVNGQPVAEWNF